MSLRRSDFCQSFLVRTQEMCMQYLSSVVTERPRLYTCGSKTSRSSVTTAPPHRRHTTVHMVVIVAVLLLLSADFRDSQTSMATSCGVTQPTALTGTIDTN